MKATEFHDPAELPQASTDDCPEDHFLVALCPHCNHVVDASCPKCHGHVEACGADIEETAIRRVDHYRHLILLLQKSRNAKFTLQCLLIATGDGFADGLSLTEIARRWGVGKATVSKHCRKIIERLQIPPSAYMRSEETADKFRLSNRRPTKNGA